MEMLAIDTGQGERAGGEALPPDLVGVRACAQELKLSPSTISRQLAGGLFKNYGSGREPRVSLAEVKAVRAAALNPAQQRPAPAAKEVKANGYHSARAEREAVNAKLAQIELDEKLGNLVDRRQVEDDFATFGRRIREGLAERARLIAAELAAIGDANDIARRIIASDEELLRTLADEFAGGASE